VLNNKVIIRMALRLSITLEVDIAVVELRIDGLG
jgi:hypothetical protein